MRGPTEWVEGNILRTVDYGESDLIVSLLTPDHGKISCFASSARKSRKRFGGGLDLFATVRAEVRASKDRGLWRMERIELIDLNLGLRTGLHRIAAAGYISDCLSSLLGEGDPHPGLYAWWQSALARLSTASFSSVTDIHLDLEMLAHCGFAPRLGRCIDCGSASDERRLFFSFDRGGVLCGRCKRTGEGRFLEKEWIEMLEAGRAVPPESIPAVRGVINAFVSHTLGRQPKSQAFREEAFDGSC